MKRWFRHVVLHFCSCCGWKRGARRAIHGKLVEIFENFSLSGRSWRYLHTYIQDQTYKRIRRDGHALDDGGATIGWLMRDISSRRLCFMCYFCAGNGRGLATPSSGKSIVNARIGTRNTFFVNSSLLIRVRIRARGRRHSQR